MSKVLKGLYGITDEVLTPIERIEKNVQEALQKGVGIIQYRDKHSDNDTLKQTALSLQKLCDRYGALFVLNDHIDLAIEIGCDALHIGQSDHENFEKIREKFKGVIGVSCYGDVALAKSFEDKGANYVAFGSFFPSKTKPNSKVVALEILDGAKKELSIPVCAIGGIEASNIDQVSKTGVDMFACIDALFNGNIEKNIEQLQKGLQ